MTTREQIIEILKENIGTYQLCDDGDPINITGFEKSADKILALPLYPKEFVEWIGWSYIKAEGGWFHRYESQNLTNLKSTGKLYEHWKNLPK